MYHLWVYKFEEKKSWRIVAPNGTLMLKIEAEITKKVFASANWIGWYLMGLTRRIFLVHLSWITNIFWLSFPDSTPCLRSGSGLLPVLHYHYLAYKYQPSLDGIIGSSHTASDVRGKPLYWQLRPRAADLRTVCWEAERLLLYGTFSIWGSSSMLPNIF